MWIEIVASTSLFAYAVVTPYAGVWIEMIRKATFQKMQTVTPYAGVWIEIEVTRQQYRGNDRHSLRGSVD